MVLRSGAKPHTQSLGSARTTGRVQQCLLSHTSYGAYAHTHSTLNGRHGDYTHSSALMQCSGLTHYHPMLKNCSVVFDKSDLNSSGMFVLF